MAHKGKLYRHLHEDNLERMLIDAYQNSNKEKTSNLQIEKIETPNKEKLEEQAEKLKKQAQNNLTLKILAFLCSILIVFFLSRATITSVDERTFLLPIEAKYKNNKQKANIEFQPSYVSVKLLGNKNTLDSINIQDLGASININEIKESKKLPVSILVPTDVTIKEVNPKDVLVNVYNR
ncbi:MAG: hypothetical protein U0354_16240 [Candidatus Sericytochromatia bacterium]